MPARKIPIKPATMKEARLPITAPEVPIPKTTRPIMSVVLITDWQMSMMLFWVIFSTPVNTAVAAVTSPPAMGMKAAI